MYLLILGFHDLLVMIDQHAAHERVRLEALLDGTVTCRKPSLLLLLLPFSQTCMLQIPQHQVVHSFHLR